MFGVEKVGAGKAALCRIVREGLIHPGSFSTKSTIGEGFQVTEAEIRTAKWRDDAGVGKRFPIADGKSLVNADRQLAGTFHLLELAEIERLAFVNRGVGHVLHAGYAVSSRFAHGCFHGMVLLLGRQRRQDTLNETSGGVFENAGWIAIFVALDFASWHVVRVSIDAGEFHGLRIHEGHVSVEAPQECRMIAGDIVDQLVGGEKWRIPACVIPKAVAQPRTLGKRSRELSDALFKLGLAVGGAKVHADERTAADEEVHVGVVEAGQEKASAEIDDASVGAGEFSNRSIVTDRKDSGTIERHRLCSGLRWIFGPYFSVDKDQTRLRRRRAATACAEHNDERVQPGTLHKDSAEEGMVIGQPPTTLWNTCKQIKIHLGRNIYTTVKLKMRTVWREPVRESECRPSTVLNLELIRGNGRANLLEWDEPFALQCIVELVYFQVLNNVGCTRWPANLDAVDSGRGAKAKVYAEITLREIASPAPDLVSLRDAASG